MPESSQIGFSWGLVKSNGNNNYIIISNHLFTPTHFFYCWNLIPHLNVM